MNLLGNLLKISPSAQEFRRFAACAPKSSGPRHLICFKQWTADMVMEIIESALHLKCLMSDTHNKRLDILAGSKVMILQEVNEPILNMAVSKAATLLGAYDTNITDNLVWDHHYNGRVFSYMCDAVFVSTCTHMCVQRFAEQSSVPVLCMRSRTHASIQSLSTMMAIIEEFGTASGVNVSYLGPSHPVLNSYLLLCPMLGANIRFKCCCDKCPVSPLLYKASEEMTVNTNTKVVECKTKDEVLKDACVVICGPTTCKKDKIGHFTINSGDIMKGTSCRWIFFHTLPRGSEVGEELFCHHNARTYTAFENMHYIAAALMANAIKGHLF